MNLLQNSVFHSMVWRLTGQDFRVLSCGLRGMPDDVARGLELYGDQHRCIPVIAVRSGNHVEEFPGPQHGSNRGLRFRGPGSGGHPAR